MEQLLQYVWKYKIYPLRELTTVDGLPVEIIDPGQRNTNAGPDFFNAKVKIDGTIWVGNVEIHMASSDWKRHGHHQDKAYDSVILHVVETIDCPVYRTNGEEIPQLQLSCPAYTRKRYEELKKTEMKPRCFSIIPELSNLTVNSWLSSLQVERLEQKTAVIRERLLQNNNHWEDAFFISLSRNFGFGINGDAFEAWAQLIPYRAVDKHRDNLFQVEAIFFGQAGLLEEKLNDHYYLELQEEYRYLKHKFELRELDPIRLKLLRLRPGNFPHIRIAQLAYLYHSQQSLFSRAMEVKTLDDVKALFQISTSEYWKDHYNFYKSSPKQEKKMGRGAIDLLIINTIVPFLYAYGLTQGNDALCAQGINFLETVKAENNYITRLWDGTGIPVFTAADSQALIQLQKQYCDNRKCFHCRFGYEYLRIK